MATACKLLLLTACKTNGPLRTSNSLREEQELNGHFLNSFKTVKGEKNSKVIITQVTDIAFPHLEAEQVARMGYGNHLFVPSTCKRGLTRSLRPSSEAFGFNFLPTCSFSFSESREEAAIKMYTNSSRT